MNKIIQYNKMKSWKFSLINLLVRSLWTKKKIRIIIPRVNSQCLIMISNKVKNSKILLLTLTKFQNLIFIYKLNKNLYVHNLFFNFLNFLFEFHLRHFWFICKFFIFLNKISILITFTYFILLLFLFSCFFLSLNKILYCIIF